MTDTAAPESWYHDDRGKPIIFEEVSADVTMTITVTHSEFQQLIDGASRGCKAWASDLKIHRRNFRIREWRVNHAEPGYNYYWHTITPRKLSTVLVRVCRGQTFEHLDKPTARDIRDLWLAPPSGVDCLNRYIDDQMADILVQLVAFGKVVYG